jgi:hypothetical protein
MNIYIYMIINIKYKKIKIKILYTRTLHQVIFVEAYLIKLKEFLTNI